jgi:hypothetical protein
MNRLNQTNRPYLMNLTSLMFQMILNYQKFR